MISTPPEAVRLFIDVLTQLGQGRGVTILPKKVHPGGIMTTTDVAELPLAEKLLLMERLWDALREQADSGIDPSWHNHVLAERLHRLDNGGELTSPWSEAKERIRAQIKAR